ncbi:MAG TPA: DinB family protein [Nitrolancea sp.]|nr:DinB family protein [Nitrolancea sp.]
MTSYDLYLESGPRRRKTMVHVLDLLGCVALGPTTEEALAATPDAIRAYRRFLRGHGEPLDPDEPFQTQVAEHITEGDWLGNGSPYLVFRPDLAPLTEEEIDTYLRWFRWLRDDLAAWAARRTPAQLDATPVAGGRSARAILLHVLGATGGYLSAALGSAKGFSALHGAAERGEIALHDALRHAAVMAEERVRATTAEERGAVRELPTGPRTLRKALRRLLEHDWEHLSELARRPDGPALRHEDL